MPCLDPESLVISKEVFQSYNIRKAFIALQSRMSIILRKTNYFVLRRACLAQIHSPGGAELPDDLVCEIKAAKNFDNLLDVLVSCPYWSWIDLRIMEAMITASGSSQAQGLLNNYKAAVFSKRLVDVLPDVPSKQVKEEYYKKLAAKLMKDPSEMTVADLLKFRSQLEGVILDINRGVCVLEHLNRGCVETHWYIPASLVDKAYQNARTNNYQFKHLSMLYLKIGHYPVIHASTDVISAPITSADAGK